MGLFCMTLSHSEILRKPAGLDAFDFWAGHRVKAQKQFTLLSNISKTNITVWQQAWVLPITLKVLSPSLPHLWGDSSRGTKNVLICANT